MSKKQQKYSSKKREVSIETVFREIMTSKYIDILISKHLYINKPKSNQEKRHIDI